jgi:hypothetical protein
MQSVTQKLTLLEVKKPVRVTGKAQTPSQLLWTEGRVYFLPCYLDGFWSGLSVQSQVCDLVREVTTAGTGPDMLLNQV